MPLVNVQVPSVCSLLLVTLLPTAALAQDGPVSEYAQVSYAYEFPFKEFFGKSKHSVGDFAEVVHRVGAVSTRGGGGSWKARRELWIEVTTADAATLRLDAKLVERGVAEDKASLFDEILEEILDTQLGWEIDVARSATGTLSTSAEPGVTWQFAFLMYVPNAGSPTFAAELVHGERELQFHEQDCSDQQTNPGRQVCVVAYEQGRRLGHGGVRSYVFRADVDPDLKLLVLGGIEAAKIAARFDDAIH